LFDLVVVALCGTIAGADSWTDIERFSQERVARLRTFLRLENGIPSHDTFGRVFAMLDPTSITALALGGLLLLARREARPVVI
jgi:DDE_Tnp_1-associated